MQKTNQGPRDALKDQRVMDIYRNIKKKPSIAGEHGVIPQVMRHLNIMSPQTKIVQDVFSPQHTH